MYPPPIYDETDVPGNVDNPRLNQAPAKDEEDAGKASTDIYEALAKRPGDELTPPAPSPKEDTTNDTAADIGVLHAPDGGEQPANRHGSAAVSLLIFAAMAYNLHLETSSLHAALQYMASMAIVSVDSLTKTVETTFGASQVPEPIQQTWESLIQETIVYVQSAFQGE